MKLDVGITDAGPTADEPAGPRSGWSIPVRPRQEPTRPDERLADRRHVREQRDRLFAGDLKVELEMVLEILADPRQLVDERDAMVRELRGRPDTRELQQTAVS